jgi:DNA-binding XRE family transcriptional regulator
MPLQYIDTNDGRLVVLREADYLRLYEAAEDADAATIIDRFRTKLAAGEEELVPADVVKRLLAGENPVRVWREHRGMKAGELAVKAGLSQAYVSQLEAGKREGSVAAMKSIAEALGVMIDDLV